MRVCANSTRAIYDVDAGMEASQAAILVEFSDQVLRSCDEQQIDLSIARLKEIEACVPGWRNKINLVGQCERCHSRSDSDAVSTNLSSVTGPRSTFIMNAEYANEAARRRESLAQGGT